MNPKIVFHDMKIEIAVKTGFVAHRLNELMYIVYDAPYCWLYFPENKKYKVEVTLQYIRERLPETAFLQSSRSVLLNIGCCKEYNRKDAMIMMDDDHKFDISRRRAKDFHKMRSNYATSNEHPTMTTRLDKIYHSTCF